MGICYEMTRYCGGQAEVRDRVDRIIDERTGKMREIRDTVTLQNMRSKTMTLRDRNVFAMMNWVTAREAS